MKDKKFCPLLVTAAAILNVHDDKTSIDIKAQDIHDGTRCSETCAWYDDLYHRCSIQSLGFHSDISYK